MLILLVKGAKLELIFIELGTAFVEELTLFEPIILTLFEPIMFALFELVTLGLGAVAILVVIDCSGLLLNETLVLF